MSNPIRSDSGPVAPVTAAAAARPAAARLTEAKVTTICQQILRNPTASTNASDLLAHWNALKERNAITPELATSLLPAAKKLDGIGKKTLLGEITTYKFDQLCANIEKQAKSASPTLIFNEVTKELKAYWDANKAKLPKGGIGGELSHQIENAAGLARAIYAKNKRDHAAGSPALAPEPAGLLYLHRINFEEMCIRFSTEPFTQLTQPELTTFTTELYKFWVPVRNSQRITPKLGEQIILVADSLIQSAASLSKPTDPKMKEIHDYLETRLAERRAAVAAAAPQPPPPLTPLPRIRIPAPSFAEAAPRPPPTPPALPEVTERLTTLARTLTNPDCLMDRGPLTLGRECQKFMEDVFKLSLDEQRALIGTNPPSFSVIFNLAMRGAIVDGENLLESVIARNGVKNDDHTAMLESYKSYCLLAFNIYGGTIPSLKTYIEMVTNIPKYDSRNNDLTARLASQEHFSQYCAQARAACSRQKPIGLQRIDESLKATINPLLDKVIENLPLFREDVASCENRDPANLEHVSRQKQFFSSLLVELSELGVENELTSEIAALLTKVRKIETYIVASSKPIEGATKISGESQHTLSAFTLKKTLSARALHADATALDLTRQCEFMPGAANHACCFIAAYNIYLNLAGTPPESLDDAIFLGLIRQQKACREHPEDEQLYYVAGQPCPGNAEVFPIIEAMKDFLTPGEDSIFSETLKENGESEQYKSLITQLEAQLVVGNGGAIIHKGQTFYAITITSKPDGGKTYTIMDSHGFPADSGAPPEFIGRAFSCDFNTPEAAAAFLAIRTPYKSHDANANLCTFTSFKLAENPTAADLTTEDREIMQANRAARLRELQTDNLAVMPTKEILRFYIDLFDQPREAAEALYLSYLAVLAPRGVTEANLVSREAATAALARYDDPTEMARTIKFYQDTFPTDNTQTLLQRLIEITAINSPDIEMPPVAQRYINALKAIGINTELDGSEPPAETISQTVRRKAQAALAPLLTAAPPREL